MKTILVPTDFSEKANDALAFALEFCDKINGRIILMHVLDFPSSSFKTTGGVDSSEAENFYKGEFIKGVHNRLNDLKASLEGNQPIETKIKYGHPFVSISKEIAEENVNYIIMGSDGASGLEEVFIGSVAEKVIRNADCPVITVKGPATLGGMKSFVFASDLTAEQDIIAQKAKEIQELLDLNMHLLKVKTPHNFLSEKDAQEQLEAFAKRNYLDRLTKNTIEADYSDEGIVAFAEKVGAGMIVMGTHGKTGLAHIFGGSRAEDVANESKIPVMTFKINL
ncbi:MAG: universal stress protein [Ekhidna sp.]